MYYMGLSEDKTRQTPYHLGHVSLPPSGTSVCIRSFAMDSKKSTKALREPARSAKGGTSKGAWTPKPPLHVEEEYHGEFGITWKFGVVSNFSRHNNDKHVLHSHHFGFVWNLGTSKCQGLEWLIIIFRIPKVSFGVLTPSFSRNTYIQNSPNLLKGLKSSAIWGWFFEPAVPSASQVSGGSTGRPLSSKSCLGKSQDSMGNW